VKTPFSVITALAIMKQRRTVTAMLVAVVALSGCATPTEQVNEQVIVGFTPLNVATGQQEIVDSLTPLHRAARDGDQAAVTTLLQQGAQVDAASTASGVTALIVAATAGHESIVDILLDAGAAVNATDAVDGTALMYAASKGYVGIVNKLLHHGAAVNLVSPKDHLDSTALTLAAGNGQNAVLEPLLNAGAEIDWRTERDGDSALLLAAELGHWSTVARLLSAGANPDLKDRYGKTACDIAAANGHDAVTQVLDEFYLAQGQDKRCRRNSKW
jgi:hypothetical protein